MKKCGGCASTENLTFTRERKPGSMGGMSQSFAGSYHLCSVCLDLCRQIGGLLAIQTMRASGKKMVPRATVAAKTLQYLQTRKTAT